MGPVHFTPPYPPTAFITKIPQAQHHPRRPESGMKDSWLAVKTLLPPGGNEAHL